MEVIAAEVEADFEDTDTYDIQVDIDVMMHRDWNWICSELFPLWTRHC